MRKHPMELLLPNSSFSSSFEFMLISAVLTDLSISMSKFLRDYTYSFIAHFRNFVLDVLTCKK